jgi:aspartate aminotransferase-like enzyme
VRAHVLAKGFKTVPEGRLRLGDAELLSPTRLNYDLAALNKTLKSKHQLVIDGGYGKLKGKTFRISNMGDETDETIAAMLKSFAPRWPRRLGLSDAQGLRGLKVERPVRQAAGA